MATTYRVTVEFSGSCDYDILLPDYVDPAKAIDDVIREYGSLDNIMNRINDSINENVVEIKLVEK